MGSEEAYAEYDKEKERCYVIKFYVTHRLNSFEALAISQSSISSIMESRS